MVKIYPSLAIPVATTLDCTYPVLPNQDSNNMILMVCVLSLFLSP